MSITLADLKLYMSQVTPDDDTPTAIGGAIDRTKRPAFSDVSGLVQVVSSTSVDTTQQVTVTGRDSTGAIVQEAKTLVGITPQGLTQNFERLLKGLKNALTVGDIAVEAQTAVLTGNNQGTTLFDAILPAGASAVDGFYNQQIYRQTGTNKGIRRVINYIGSSRTITFDHAFTAFIGPSVGDNVTGSGDAFRLSKGEFFEKSPAEVIQIRRPFYNAAADAAGGSTRKYYEKLFWENTNGQGLDLSSAQVIEAGDPNADIAFALESVFNGNGTNGVGNNRQVAPSVNVTTFDSLTKNLPGGSQDLHAGSQIGMWLELTLLAAAAAQNSTYTPRLQGQTS
jgi:hypothetical protein